MHSRKGNGNNGMFMDGLSQEQPIVIRSPYSVHTPIAVVSQKRGADRLVGKVLAKQAIRKLAVCDVAAEVPPTRRCSVRRELQSRSPLDSSHDRDGWAVCFSHP